MKELLRQLAAHNVWANQKLFEIIVALPQELQTKELPGSFSSLHALILHMWDAESIWWQRMKLQEVVVPPGSNFKGTTADAVQALLNQNKLWEDWTNAATDMALEHVFSYYNTKRELFKQPTYQVLLQMLTHASYHRGQLVNMLRQLGQNKIPGTDFILWSRKK